MTEIRAALRAASRRLFLNALLRDAVLAATVAVIALFIVRVVQQLSGAQIPWFAPYGGVVAWCAAGAALAALVAAVIRMPSTRSVALTLDDSAHLRERLSTALHVETRDDAWSRAVVEDARRTASSVNVARALPISPPRWWTAPLAASAALLVLWFALPAFDLFGKAKARENEQRAIREANEVKAELKSQEQKLAELLTKARVEAPTAEKSEAEGAADARPVNAEDIQRAAVRKLTGLTESLAQIRTGDKGRELDAMRDVMKQLRSPGQGPLDEMQRQMARGNFDQARQALDDMAKKLADSSMTPEEQAAAKKQLDSLAEQLKKLAEENKALADQLQKAGLDQKTARELAAKAAADPAAIKEALNAMKNLTPEQQKKLLEAAMAAAKASQNASEMSQSMSQMAQGMSSQGMDQSGMEGMSELSGQLGQAEMLAEELEAVEAAMSEAGSQLQALGEALGQCDSDGDGVPDGWAVGQWKAGDSSKTGPGTGGPGRGWGAQKNDLPADFILEKDKAKIKTGAGPMIGSRLVWGSQVRGESVAEFEAAVEAGSRAAAEAFETHDIPPHLQNAVRRYYGTLTSKAKAPPPAPSTDAPDSTKK